MLQGSAGALAGALGRLWMTKLRLLEVAWAERRREVQKEVKTAVSGTHVEIFAVYGIGQQQYTERKEESGDLLEHPRERSGNNGCRDECSSHLKLMKTEEHNEKGGLGACEDSTGTNFSSCLYLLSPSLLRGILGPSILLPLQIGALKEFKGETSEEIKSCTVPGGLATVRKHFGNGQMTPSMTIFAHSQYQHKAAEEISGTTQLPLSSNTREAECSATATKEAPLEAFQSQETATEIWNILTCCTKSCSNVKVLCTGFSQGERASTLTQHTDEAGKKNTPGATVAHSEHLTSTTHSRTETSQHPKSSPKQLTFVMGFSSQNGDSSAISQVLPPPEQHTDSMGCRVCRPGAQEGARASSLAEAASQQLTQLSEVPQDNFTAFLPQQSLLHLDLTFDKEFPAYR
ncbi:hypothetical protein Anapl_11601 [Anas platyrhynchos]|uniref:Uncharacterized protein n=1 Tax=Anas platyrhynchos TaxID=8839 RepID=R0LLJ0_ANAPL|nr:hypothetical protein Anapl_11601 [Anas platyrhynchos]